MCNKRKIFLGAPRIGERFLYLLGPNRRKPGKTDEVPKKSNIFPLCSIAHCVSFPVIFVAFPILDLLHLFPPFFSQPKPTLPTERSNTISQLRRPSVSHLFRVLNTAPPPPSSLHRGGAEEEEEEDGSMMHTFLRAGSLD